MLGLVESAGHWKKMAKEGVVPQSLQGVRMCSMVKRWVTMAQLGVLRLRTETEQMWAEYNIGTCLNFAVSLGIFSEARRKALRR
jgi:hypothetical protein